MIEVKNLKKTFHLKTGDVTAVNDVSLHIEDGAIYGVIGYSGAGKSSLVRCLNLLEIPDEGTITMGEYRNIEIRKGVPYYEGKRMTAQQQNRMRRGIGMIFQHFNLLERSTVFDNIAYPLKYTGRSREEISARVKELLELVDLQDKIDVFPSQLSGGQKQRVAIARALAANPKILLSDEATSALDPDATESILTLLKDLNRKLGITIVIITHEMAVIKAIADRVAVMEEGSVVEEGSVYDIFSDPQAPITRKFIASSSPLGKIDKMIADNSSMTQVKPGEKLVKLVFQKDCVGEHILTSVAQECGVNLNIILANVEYLHGNPLGGTIGVLSGDEKQLADGIRFLEENHVRVEVLKDGSLD
ncbi:MAG: ATP-binding cassette domain-containing protein [Oscillospiraceae bacterium]|nr:ATP-binding cassette domain-containing protein [Oscillospiraceae bacterium]